MNKLIDQHSGFPIGTWYRTCQECGHRQVDKKPANGEPMTTAYSNRKCRKCKSESLDYGIEASDQSEWTE